MSSANTHTHTHTRGIITHTHARACTDTQALGVETEADIKRLAAYFIVPDSEGEGGPARCVHANDVSSVLRRFLDDGRRTRAYVCLCMRV